MEVQDSVYLVSNLQDDLQDTLTVGILDVTLLPFTHTIYSFITHKIVKRLLDSKTLERGFHNTHILERATPPQQSIHL